MFSHQYFDYRGPCFDVRAFESDFFIALDQKLVQGERLNRAIARNNLITNNVFLICFMGC
jgi:hypothetical protein